ncbi:hypothetical protein GQ457_05G023670 [Hibiscus cannabinus]
MKMSEGSPVGAHVIKMMRYIQTLERFGFPLKNELANDVIMQSFPDCFKPFNGSKSILLIHKAKRNGKGKELKRPKGNGKSKPEGKDALKPRKGISKETNVSTMKSLDTGKGTVLST